MSLLSQLPPPPKGKTGWPWTEETSPQVYEQETYWPKISIVTPSYNQGEFIEETIRSILLQNYPNLEYLVIDGGSSDETVEVLKKYDPWITYWVSEKDRGQTHAINKGIELCTGDVFNWINSDDYLLPSALLSIGSCFLDSNISMVASRYQFRFENNLSRQYSAITSFPSNNLPKTIGTTLLSQPGSYFRLQNISSAIPLSEHLHYTMDQELWLSYLICNGLSGAVKTVEDTAIFRVHEESKTNKFDTLFVIDRNSIFMSIAKKIGVDDTVLSGILSVSKGSLLPDYEFSLSRYEYDQKVIEASIHYYLLSYLDRFYGERKLERSKEIVNAINPHFLDKEHKALFKKIRLRLKVPAIAKLYDLISK